VDHHKRDSVELRRNYIAKQAEREEHEHDGQKNPRHRDHLCTPPVIFAVRLRHASTLSRLLRDVPRRSLRLAAQAFEERRLPNGAPDVFVCREERAPQAPDAANLAAVADQLEGLVSTGDPKQRKALFRLLVKDLRVNARGEILPTYRVVTDAVCALPSSVAVLGSNQRPED
jgi:hypothetical protein